MFGKILAIIGCLFVFSEGSRATDFERVEVVPHAYEYAVVIAERIKELGDDVFDLNYEPHHEIYKLLRDLPGKCNSVELSLYALTAILMNLPERYLGAISLVNRLREQLICDAAAATATAAARDAVCYTNTAYTPVDFAQNLFAGFLNDYNGQGYPGLIMLNNIHDILAIQKRDKRAKSLEGEIIRVLAGLGIDYREYGFRE